MLKLKIKPLVSIQALQNDKDKYLFSNSDIFFQSNKMRIFKVCYLNILLYNVVTFLSVDQDFGSYWSDWVLHFREVNKGWDGFRLLFKI